MFLMVCGTRKPLSKEEFDLVRNTILEALTPETTIIEGCCKGSPDVVAEQIAAEFGFPIQHFPGTEGNYLKRNVEMVEKADQIISCWNGWSYGTAHVIATATMLGKPVKIVKLR